MKEEIPVKKSHTQNTHDKNILLEELIAFYWRILDDGGLKPADRIASAKRLEALLSPESAEPAPVNVTLNLPKVPKRVVKKSVPKKSLAKKVAPKKPVKRVVLPKKG